MYQHLVRGICIDIKGNVNSPTGIALPHQQEIERMSSFRDQLGEDWLRYQHHLDRSFQDNQPCPQAPPLPNGGNTTAVPSLDPNALDVLPPLRLSSETVAEVCDIGEDQDTESTLQWLCHSPQPTESTLEDSVVDGQPFSQTRPRAESKVLAEGDREDSKEDEEEDLGGKSLATFKFPKRHEGDCGDTRASVCSTQDWSDLKEDWSMFLFLLVDLCRPLLVGILSDNEEEDEGEMRYDSSMRREMFLCIKQHLALEVDVKHGRERCRLELSSLTRVKTTEAVWIRGVRKGTRHAIKCSHFGCCFAHCQVHSPVYFQV